LLGFGIFKAISNLRKAKKVKQATLAIGSKKIEDVNHQVAISKQKADIAEMDPEKAKGAKEKLKKQTDKFHAQADHRKAQIEKMEQELTDKIGGSKYLGRIHQKYKADSEAAIAKTKLDNADILQLAPDKIKELKLKHKELQQASTELEAGLKDETDKLKADTKDVKDGSAEKVAPLIRKIDGINKNIEAVAKDIEAAGGEIEAEEKDAEDAENKKKEDKQDAEDDDGGGIGSKLKNLVKKESVDEAASDKIDELEKDLYKLLHKRQVIITDINKLMDKEDARKVSQEKEKEYLDKITKIGGTADTDATSKVKDEEKGPSDAEKAQADLDIAKGEQEVLVKKMNKAKEDGDTAGYDAAAKEVSAQSRAIDDIEKALGDAGGTKKEPEKKEEEPEKKEEDTPEEIDNSEYETKAKELEDAGWSKSTPSTEELDKYEQKDIIKKVKPTTANDKGEISVSFWKEKESTADETQEKVEHNISNIRNLLANSEALKNLYK